MIENQVHTKVTADASQANAEMGKFQKALDAVGRAGRSIGSQVRMAVDDAAVAFGKFNLAMGGVQQAIGLVNAALDTAFEQNRLDKIERVLPAGIVDRFRVATDKLISRQDALRLSVKGLTGDFKMTEPEMQKVLQAAVALQEKGFGPAAEIADKLLEALGPKGVDKLDDFGIALEKSSSKAYDLNAAMQKFDEIIQSNHVDESTKNLADLKASLEDVGQAIKSVVAEAAKGIAWLVAQRNTATGKQVRQMAFGWLDYMGPQPKQQEDPLVAYNRQLSESEVGFDASKNDPRKPVLGPEWTPLSEEDQREIGRRREEERKRRAKERYKPRGQNLGEHTTELPTWFGGDFGGQGDFGAAAWDSTSLDFLEAQQNQDGRNYLNESVGYPQADELAQLRKDLGDTTSAVGASYAALSSGLAAAVDAAISGSDSIGRAAAKASASVLKSLAIEATGKAGWYAVEALGYGISGNAAKASASLVAAGQYAATAVALGGLSAGLGSLASSGGSSGGGRPGYGAGAAGGGYMGHGAGGGGGDAINITVNVGEGFGGAAGGDVSKAVAEGVSRALRQAERQGSRRNYTTATYSG